MLERQIRNSGELDRGTFDPFYGEYVENKIRDKIVAAVNNPDAPDDGRIEFSVYDNERNLQHWRRLPELDLSADVFQHIEDADLPDGGQYILRYNFFEPDFGSPDGDRLYVQSISGDRQEIRVRPTPESGQRFANRFINFFRARFQLPGYTDFPNYTIERESADERETVEPRRKVVNFGDNQYYHILNWTNVVEVDEDGLVEFQDDGLPIFKRAAIIRLDQALPNAIEVGDEFWIDSEFSRPYLDRFEIFRFSEATAVNELSGPDFSVDLDDRSERRSTFESFDDIVNTEEFETSQSFVESRLSGSEDVDLNVDYTNFENFIHFSSVEERLRNFRFKLRKINQNITEIGDLTGVQSAGRQETLKRQIEELIGSFDAYERWLFRSESDRAYPKKQNGALHPPDSPEAEQWFSEILSDARVYDDRNDSALRKQVPEFVREDQSNEEFVLFVDMVGHWFDVNWIYIDHIEHLTDQTEDAFEPESLSADLSRVVAESMGLETYDGFDAEEFFDEIFDSSQISEIFGSADLARPTQPEVDGGKIDYTRFQAQQQVWRRLLSNLTHHYKTRGTESSIDMLTSIFGIPSESLVIRESGGSAAQGSDRNEGSFNLTETSHLLPFVSSQSIRLPWNLEGQFQSPSGFDDMFDVFEEWPKGVEVRFRTEYQGGVPIKLFDLGGLASVRLERTDLNTENGKLVLEVREADGVRIEAESEELPLFNGEWTNVLFQIRENEPFIDVFVQQRSPFGNFRNGDQLSLNIDFETALNFFTSDDLHFGGNLSGQRFQTGVPFIGDLDQVNVWEDTLSGELFDAHSLAPKRKGVDNSELTSGESVFDRDLEFLRRHLHFRLDFPVPQDLAANPTLENLSDQESVEGLTAEAQGFTDGGESPWQFDRYERVNFFDPTQVGATSYFNSKVRIEDAELDKPLRSNQSTENRDAELITKDSNRVGIFFSPFTSANRDVLSEIGIDDVNAVLGNPNDQLRDDYYLLDGLNRMYWNKYDGLVDAQTYIHYIDEFYDAFFNHVESSVPARASLVDGVVIEPSILERDREPLPIGDTGLKDKDTNAPAGADADASPNGRSLTEPSFLPDIIFSDTEPTDCDNGDIWAKVPITSGVQKPGQVFGQFDNPTIQEGEEKDVWVDIPENGSESGPTPFVDFTFDTADPTSSQGENGELLGTPVSDAVSLLFSSGDPIASEGDDGDLFFKAQGVSEDKEEEVGIIYNSKQEPTGGDPNDLWFEKVGGEDSEGPLPFSNIIFDTNQPDIGDGRNGEIWLTPDS